MKQAWWSTASDNIDTEAFEFSRDAELDTAEYMNQGGMNSTIPSPPKQIAA